MCFWIFDQMYSSDAMTALRYRVFYKVVCVCLRIGRQMTYCDYTPTVHFTVTWRKNEENTKYRVFMRILNLFLDFRSDARFRRNDGFKIARHFESLALLCVCGFLSLVPHGCGLMCPHILWAKLHFGRESVPSARGRE